MPNIEKQLADSFAEVIAQELAAVGLNTTQPTLHAAIYVAAKRLAANLLSAIEHVGEII